MPTLRLGPLRAFKQHCGARTSIVPILQMWKLRLRRNDLPEEKADKCRAGIQTQLRFISLQIPKTGPYVTIMVELQAQG